MTKLMELFQNPKIKFLIIGLLIILFIIVMASSMKKDKVEEPNNEPSPSTTIELTEELQQELTRKIALLKYSNYCETPSAGDVYLYDCLYRKDKTTSAELSERYRIYTLTLAMDSLLETRNNYIVGNVTVDNITFQNTQTFSLNNLKQEYESLYGQTSNFAPEAVNSVLKFPYVRYDTARQKIFYQTTGVKTEINNNQIAEYIKDYESDTTNVYVYVNIAYASEKAPQTYGIYTNKNKTTEIATSSFADFNRLEIINDSNTSQLITYKYTFTKEENTNNLIFNQVEIVK